MVNSSKCGKKLSTEKYTMKTLLGVGLVVGLVLTFILCLAVLLTIFTLGFYDEAKIGSSLCYTSPSSILC